MRITIFTPTVDDAEFADEAIASVPYDEHEDIEHIVVHDGSEEFRRRLMNRFPHLIILSGTGEGATAAARTAISVASGDFILSLNSDDRLLAGSVAALCKSAAQRPDIRIWTGGTRIFRIDHSGREITVRLVDEPALTSPTLGNILDDLPLLTARFVHRSIYEEIGNWDLDYSECSDREFMLRAVIAGIAEAPLGVRISELREHAGSRSINRRTGWVPPYLAEHLRLADEWLVCRDLPKETRRALRCWRARELLRFLSYSARAGQYRHVIETSWRQTLRDPAWWLLASGSLAARARRRRSSK